MFMRDMLKGGFKKKKKKIGVVVLWTNFCWYMCLFFIFLRDLVSWVYVPCLMWGPMYLALCTLLEGCTLSSFATGE
jgi:hypothetical protein